MKKVTKLSKVSHIVLNCPVLSRILRYSYNCENCTKFERRKKLLSRKVVRLHNGKPSMKNRLSTKRDQNHQLHIRASSTTLHKEVDHLKERIFHKVFFIILGPAKDCAVTFSTFHHQKSSISCIVQRRKEPYMGIG